MAAIGRLKAMRRLRRHRRIRRKVGGAPGRPRLAIFRSLNHIYAQVIDDTSSTTICSAATVQTDVVPTGKSTGNKAAAEAVGAAVAARALEKGVTSVVFDRGGFIYHGRVKALADAARKAGLAF